VPWSTEEFRRRDVRLKCSECRGWMRNKPTEKTPLKRAQPPRAGHCTSCAIEAVISKTRAKLEEAEWKI